MRRSAPHIATLGLLVAFAAWLTWPLVTRMDDTLVSWGDPVFQMWTISWNWHALTTDPLDIFNANVFYPWRNVLAYSDHLFGQTLLVLPALALTGNGILANNLAFFMALVLSGLAMYWLALDISGHRWAATLAALAYTFAPPRMAHVEHLHMLFTAALPLALLCLHRIVRSRSRSRNRWGLALGATFFAQGLLGIYFLYFMMVMLVIAGAVYLLIAALDRDGEAIRGLLLAAGACAAAGVLLLPTLLPYWQVSQELGVEREPAEVSFWSAKREDYLAAWPGNDLWGERTADNFRSIEQALFPGLALTALATVGLLNRRGGRRRWVLAAIVAGSVLLSFGLTGFLFGREIPLPYRLPYDLLPGFRAIRVPARFGHLALIGLAPLAALGAELSWRRFRRRLPQRSRAVAGAAVLVGALALVGAETSTSLTLPDPLPHDNPRADYAYIAEHPGPTIELPMGEGPVASAWPNFWSTKHWSPVANGFSGIQPPTYDLLRERSKQFPSPDFVRLLQGIGIEHVIVHADMQAERRRELEAALQDYPDIELALDGPDAVYTLAPDPWIWRLAEAAPAGETVALPDISADPLTYGMIIAILQRTDHDVVGNGTIDYFELQPIGDDVCYAIFDDSIAPDDFGYIDAALLTSETDYRLYRIC